MSDPSRAHFRAGHHSQIGAGHIVDATPNQDAALSVFEDDRRVVVAVADGHGDLLHIRSDRGSKFAVEAACHVVLASLASLEATSSDGMEQAMRKVISNVLERWCTKVDSDMRDQSLSAGEFAAHLKGDDAEADRLLKEARGNRLAYGSTLLIAAASATGVWCWRLGDGDALVVDEPGGIAAIFPDETEDVTHSLCESSPAQWLETRHIPAAGALPRLVMLTTDGYRKSYDSAADFVAVIKDIAGRVEQHGFDAVMDRLPAWLENVTRNGSGDDITAALIWRRPTTASKPVASAPDARNVTNPSSEQGTPS